MLNIDEIQNGLVIDHIQAGTAIGLLDLLGIKSNRTASVAPVSYTHLDVYKRQIKAIALLLRRFSIKPCTLTVLPIEFCTWLM